MMEASKTAEELRVDSAASELTQQGFRVVMNPCSGELPFDLGTYRPDLIAFHPSGVGGVVLEVKGSGARLSIDTFQELAENIARYQGWRFVLVTLDDVTEDWIAKVHDGLPSWNELSVRIATVATLLNGGMLEPALLYLWSSVEALLRKRAIEQAIPVERLPSLKLVRHMYSSGELSMSQFDMLMHAFSRKNSVAHGLEIDLSAAELHDYLSLARTLVVAWRHPKGVEAATR